MPACGASGPEGRQGVKRVEEGVAAGLPSW